MNILDLPAHIWGLASSFGVALISAGSLVFGHLVGARGRKRDGLSGLVDQLQEEVTRLDSRVETLEKTRDAYRSWSHVLWAHLHDPTIPRLPPPTWPIDLPR